MLHRLKQYLDYKGIKTASFERSIGMSNASFGKSLKNNGTIGADKLEIILKKYTDLDLIWLITGEGEMIKGPGADNACGNQINLLKKEIAWLKQQLNDMRDNLNTKNELIQALREKLNMYAKENSRVVQKKFEVEEE